MSNEDTKTTEAPNANQPYLKMNDNGTVNLCNLEVTQSKVRGEKSVFKVDVGSWNSWKGGKRNEDGTMAVEPYGIFRVKTETVKNSPSDLVTMVQDNGDSGLPIRSISVRPHGKGSMMYFVQAIPRPESVNLQAPDTQLAGEVAPVEGDLITAADLKKE